MSDLIPDSISTADLQWLSLRMHHLKQKKCWTLWGSDSGRTPGVRRYGELNRMSKEVPCAMLPKVICNQLITSLLGWHSRRGMNITTASSDHDDCIQAMMWHRDAGKLQAILQLLDSIDCGEGAEDFLCDD